MVMEGLPSFPIQAAIWSMIIQFSDGHLHIRSCISYDILISKC